MSNFTFNQEATLSTFSSRPSSEHSNRQEDDIESRSWLLEKPSSLSQQRCSRFHVSKGQLWAMTVLNVVILSISTIISMRPVFAMNHCMRETSEYSPILDKVHLEMSRTLPGNSTLLSTDEATSIYSHDPSEAVDSAWDVLSAEGAELLTVTRSEAISLGFDPNVIVKAPIDWNLGSDIYPVQVAVFHQLHCFDELRKQIHSDHYYKPLFGDQYPKFHFAHKDHCIHVLRRSIMCQASVDIIPHYWREGTTRPRAEFNPERFGKCRNFEELVRWNRKNAVKDINKRWASIQRPGDAVVLPAPTPRLYK